jgi:glycosyltransferase involved in cell wall biosynthesis
MTTGQQASITVIVPVRNGDNFLSDAVSSVLAQTCDEFRLVISDNASTDSTPAIAARFAQDRRVKVVRRDRQMTMLEHFNLCLEEVSTEFYMLLCHDDLLASPQALAKALEVARANPSVAAIYCDLQYIDAKSRPVGTRRFGREGEVDGREVARQAVVSSRNRFGIPLLARTASRGDHLYDLTLPYAADVEMATFLSGAGAAWYIPEFLIANRYHGKNSTRGLLHNTRRELLAIAERYDLRLGMPERALSAVSSVAVAGAKIAFFALLAWRERRAHNQ